VTSPSPAPSTASAKLPFPGSAASSCGLCISKPSSPSDFRGSFTRVSPALRCAAGASVTTGSSIDHAIATVAAVRPRFRTRYRSTVIGNPEASASSGMNGVPAVSDTSTGSARS
jgi:hypothetical protein